MKMSRWLWMLIALIIAFTVVVLSRPAFQQKENQVVIRLPGHRWLSDPQPAQPWAEQDFTFALLSCAAYDPIIPEPNVTLRCPHAQTDLGPQWSQWTDFPNADLRTEMNTVHLRAHVWENRLTGLVVVAFGGTESSSGKDWMANTHWLHPFIKDEYTVAGRSFARAFAQELAQRRGLPGQEYLASSRVFATGHSLGAGLAQKFAYSLPASEFNVQKVTGVYAFDTSPVTSFLNTTARVRKENEDGLEIVRIYERGEGLAALRAITAAFHPPPTSNPSVTQRRYNLFDDDRYGVTNPLSSHSISDLAYGLKKVASARP